MHDPEPSEIAALRYEYTVANASSRQGSAAGTAETWSLVLAIRKGEEVVWIGDKMRVPNGVNSRGFLFITLSRLGW
jgi:hypothetical protein